MHYSSALVFLTPAVQGLLHVPQLVLPSDSCRWSPLQSNVEDIWCGARPRRQERPQPPDPQRVRQDDGQAGWTGPRHCLGEYCVFSNRGFARGITVVTTPENAEKIAELPSAEYRPGGSSPPPYAVSEVAGKGLGAIANRTIRRGERVMAEPPAVMVHRAVLEDMLGDPAQERLLGLAVQKLPAARRRAVTRQMGDGIGHVLFTNSFQMDVGGDAGAGHHFGNFPEVSRLNHDCRPNLAFYIDANLTHHTHAVRDIAPGEELTISYVNPFDPHAERQSQLHAAWGFRCACAQCSSGSPAASDANLADITRLEAELGDVMSTTSPAAVARLLELYEAERLHAKLAGAYTLAALNYALFGDAARARRYAELAAEAVELEFGPDAGDVRGMRELAADPKRHWSWRRRRAG